MRQQPTGGSKQTRKADTSRTSSQGRKLSSGKASPNKKGDAKIDDDNKNIVREEYESKKRKPAMQRLRDQL